MTEQIPDRDPVEERFEAARLGMIAAAVEYRDALMAMAAKMIASADAAVGHLERAGRRVVPTPGEREKN
jgi:hypothetical protein